MKRVAKRAPRRLSFETLENRRVLRTITVTATHDEFDGNIFGDDVSLRDALFYTNNDSGDHTINFSPNLAGKTIQLTDELKITRNVKIQGLGADKLTISTTGSKRLISIEEGFRSVPTVEIQGIKFSGTNTADTGAAIQVLGANVVIRDSWITGNIAKGFAAGVAVTGGSENPDTPTATTIINSTISGNAARFGGGVMVNNRGQLFIINSTLSGNSAKGQGGGVYAVSGTVNITNSTIALNRADANGVVDPGTERGGGISRVGANVIVRNSLVVGNFRGVGSTPSDIDGTMSLASTRVIVGDAGSAGGLQHNVSQNFVGNNGVGTVNTATVIDPTLKNNGGKTPTHNLPAGSPAIDTGSNGLAVDQNGVLLAKDQRGILRRIDGDLNGVSTVDRGAVEVGVAPVINLSGALNYTEQAAPQIVTTSVTIVDPDSPNFAGGLLYVAVSSATASDVLAIRHQGTGAGQIGVSGNQVTFGGALIGTYTGGPGAPLRVFLKSNATKAAVEALIRNVTFQNLADNPPTTARKVNFLLTDNQGFQNAPAYTLATIVPVDDPPVLGNLGQSTISHNLVNNLSTPLSQGTITDPDTAFVAGGALTVKITQTAGSDNRLNIGSPFTRSGNSVMYLGTTVATVNANGGVGTTDLIVTFNAAATLATVQLLMRSIQFTIVDPEIIPPTGDNEDVRVLRFSFVDGAGRATNALNISVDPLFIRG